MGFFDFFTDRTPAEPAEILDDGRVKVVAEGTAVSCARLVDILRGGDTAGRVDEVLVEGEEPSGSFRGFGIR